MVWLKMLWIYLRSKWERIYNKHFTEDYIYILLPKIINFSNCIASGDGYEDKVNLYYDRKNIFHYQLYQKSIKLQLIMFNF